MPNETLQFVESLYSDTLQLHSRRAKAYHEWRDTFSSVLNGVIPASEYEAKAIVITQEFQTVSSKIREVQKTAEALLHSSSAAPSDLQERETEVHDNAQRAVIRRLSQMLMRTIDAVQEKEKERYEVEVERQRTTAVYAQQRRALQDKSEQVTEKAMQEFASFFGVKHGDQFVNWRAGAIVVSSDDDDDDDRDAPTSGVSCNCATLTKKIQLAQEKETPQVLSKIESLKKTFDLHHEGVQEYMDNLQAELTALRSGEYA